MFLPGVGEDGSARMTALPYKTTPVFDQDSLPAALHHEHSTKVGVWGLLRVLEGEVQLVFCDSGLSVRATPEKPALIPPQDVHHFALCGPMKMQVEFYREAPFGAA